MTVHKAVTRVGKRSLVLQQLIRLHVVLTCCTICMSISTGGGRFQCIRVRGCYDKDKTYLPLMTRSPLPRALSPL